MMLIVDRQLATNAQLHPRLLYWCRGRQLVGDAYTLPGWERNRPSSHSILINASSYPKAVGAIAKDLKGSDHGRQAAQLIAALKDRHGAIARFFHSGAGVELQAVDADMAERVLVELLKKNVVTLPSTIPSSSRGAMKEFRGRRWMPPTGASYRGVHSASRSSPLHRIGSTIWRRILLHVFFLGSLVVWEDRGHLQPFK